MNEYISFDLAEAKTLDYVRALGSNIGDYAWVYVEGADDEDFTENLTSEYLSGAEFKAGHFISQILKRYLRFKIYDGVCFVGGVSPVWATDVCIVNGKIYVANKYKISMFDAETLAYLSSFGSYGSGDGQIREALSLCSDGEYIYIAEYYNNRIQKFTLTGQYVAKLGSEGSGDDKFYHPRGIRYYDGKLYVADTDNNRVKIHNASDLSYVDSFTAISVPRAISVDVENNYLVVKTWDAVYVYRLSDKSLVRSQSDLVLGTGILLVGQYLYLSDQNSNFIRKYNYSDFSVVGDYSPGSGSGPGQLNSAYHLYYWSDKNLILCGNYNDPYYVVGITPDLKFQSNEDGYIQIGHILASEKKSFERSAVTAFSEKYDDKSVKIETENLVVYHVVKEPVFQVALSIDHLKREDADMLKEFFFDHGIHRPFSLYIEDQARGNYTIDNVVFREIPEIVYRFYDNFSVSFRLREVK